jgi:ABC-type antimicrobial peptide transport system permease subunit
VLAIVGVYGIVAYSVVQRTREIGVRLALGARPIQIVRAVVREGAGLAVLGIALGFGAAWSLAHYLESILYNVKTTDAVTYFGVAVVLGSCALLASLVPARRAARLDPTVALRTE